MFKLFSKILGLFGLKWYDKVDVRCPKCGKKAVVIGEVIKADAKDQLTGEVFDRYTYSVMCSNPKCGCTGALSEIWEQEVRYDRPQTIKILPTSEDTNEVKRRLKDEKDEVMQQVEDELKKLGATDEEILEALKELSEQIDAMEVDDEEDEEEVEEESEDKEE